MEHHHGHLFFSIFVIFLLFSLTLLSPNNETNLITGQVTQENSKQEKTSNCEYIEIQLDGVRNRNELQGQLCLENGEQIVIITSKPSPIEQKPPRNPRVRNP